MKILHVNYNDSLGGAGIAARRLCEELNSHGHNSVMIVHDKTTTSNYIIGPKTNISRLVLKIRCRLTWFITKLQSTKNPILHSPSIIPNPWLVNIINNSDADIVHLHWVQNEMLSLFDIARIKKPVVWTLHDMWLLCGAEHLSSDNRFLQGYYKSNRPVHESGLDVNRIIWSLKRRYIPKNIFIIAPSRWMFTSAKGSRMLGKHRIFHIPNLINTDQLSPNQYISLRSQYSLPKDSLLICFGSANSGHMPHKGIDLLRSAINFLPESINGMKLYLIIFGSELPGIQFNIPHINIGKLQRVSDIQSLLSGVDVVAIPSRQDNLPNLCLEALSCGTPVVAFNIGGIPDMVNHRINGYLAKEEDPLDYSVGLRYILANPESLDFEKNARASVIERFDQSTICKKHISLYNSILKESSGTYKS